MTSIRRMRPFSWLLILLLFNLLLLSIQVQNKEGTLLLHSWVLALVNPGASAFRAVTGSASRFFDHYLFLLDAAEENRALRHENAQLRVEVNRLSGLAAMIPRLRSLQDLQAQYAFATVPAAVVLRGTAGSSPFLRGQMTLNQGTTQGVGVDSAVFNARGLIGRVFVAASSHSQVELITAETAAVGALLKESRIHGVVFGTGSGILRLHYIRNSENVEPGEIVLTSGTDRVYPKGIPVGRVVHSSESALIYRDITLEPFVDFQRIEEVLVETSASAESAKLEEAGSEDRRLGAQR